MALLRFIRAVSYELSALSLELQETFRGFDGAGHGGGGGVDCGFDLAAGSLDDALGFFAEALGLLFEVVGCVLEVFACVVYASAEALAGDGAFLRGVEEGDGGSCGDSDAKCEPVILCAHEILLVLRN
jgi:hypothetical protein